MLAREHVASGSARTWMADDSNDAFDQAASTPADLYSRRHAFDPVDLPHGLPIRKTCSTRRFPLCGAFVRLDSTRRAVTMTASLDAVGRRIVGRLPEHVQTTGQGFPQPSERPFPAGFRLLRSGDERRGT